MDKAEIDRWTNGILEASAKLDSTPNSLRHHLHVDPKEFGLQLQELISKENPLDRYNFDDFEKIGQGLVFLLLKSN